MDIPANLFVHPIIGGISVLLVIISYALKGGGRKFQTYHYWAGWSAWGVMTVGIIYAFLATSLLTTTVEDFLFSIGTISWHFYWGFLLWIGMSVQTFWGEAMRRNPKMILRWRQYHKTISLYLLWAVLIMAILGTPITFLLLKNSPTLQTVWVAVVFLVWGGVVWLLWGVENSALEPRFRRQTKLVERETDFQMRVFPEQEIVNIAKNESVLTANLRNGIPHTHVCGGNARCSTCRVLVVAGLDNFQPRNPAEQRLADRLNFGDRIRLACQSRITGDVTLRRLVLDEIDIEIVNQLRMDAQPTVVGHEENAAIMFFNITGFTRFSEDQLPYDVIHALNRYFRLMGQVIDSYGGKIYNYMDNRMMAVFSQSADRDASWRAVQAAVQMLVEIKQIQLYFFRQNFEDKMDKIDINIGVHYGQTVVGEIGIFDQRQPAAIGKTVNYASRIEAVNQDAGTRLLVSQEVYDMVSDQVQIGRKHWFTPQGKTEENILYEIVDLK